MLWRWRFLRQTWSIPKDNSDVVGLAECRFDFGFMFQCVGDDATSLNQALPNMDKLTILMDKLAL